MRLQPANFTYADSNWKKLTPNLPVLKDSDPKELGYGGRDFQITYFEQTHNKKRTLLIAPTGSGKSLMQVFHAGREIIESNYTLKQVFIVPQLNIGNGFSEYKHRKLRINGVVYDWEITVNCCKDSKDSVSTIKEFLLNSHDCNYERPNKVLGGVTAVVSYAALLGAWSQMTLEEKLNVVCNISFRLDEGHHIEGVCDNVIPNCLGEFCKFILDNDERLHICTATFFRGNQGIILSNKHLESFEIFRVPFLEHWDTLGLRGLHQNYNCYEDGDDLFVQIINSVKSESKEPTLIIVPADGVKFFKTINKWKWVEKLVNSLKKIVGNDNVLDLVSPDTQDSDKVRLTSETQDFSIIVTCGIGREGSDWPPCSRIHNTVLDGNVLQLIQKLGRALRQSDGKLDVKMINYIPHFHDWNDDSDNIRERLSDRFNSVVAASMLDDMFYPILMPALPIDNTSDGLKLFSLEDVFGSKRSELIEDMMQRVMSIPISERTGESIDEIIDEIIDDYAEDMIKSVSNDVLHDRLRKEIVRRLSPDDLKLKLEGIIIDFIRKEGWDKVVREYVAPNSPFIGQAITEDLEELQKFLTNSDWLENMEQIKKIGIENIEKGSFLYHFLLRQRIGYIKAKQC